MISFAPYSLSGDNWKYFIHAVHLRARAVQPMNKHFFLFSSLHHFLVPKP